MIPSASHQLLAHSKGMLFGLYSDAGYQTCAGRPGSLGYEPVDANTYAYWNVDYLVFLFYDQCLLLEIRQL